MTGRGKHDGGTAGEATLLLDLSEVFAVRWFLGAGLQAVHIQGLQLARPPPHFANLLLPPQPPSLHFVKHDAKAAAYDRPGTCEQWLWCIVASAAFWLFFLRCA